MRVLIEKLAPTGEGIARTPEGVGFVSGALPGEQVEAEVERLGKNFWKGRAVEIFVPSRERVAGPHALCAGCDWAHFEPAAALEAKRGLFLETMERIGAQERETFGALPAEPSPPRYRLRNRFHVSGKGGEAEIGYFAPRTHRVEPLSDCEAISVETAASLPPIREAIARSGVRVKTLALLESLDSSQRLAGAVLDPVDRDAAGRAAAALSPLFSGLRLEVEQAPPSEIGSTSLTLRIGERLFPVSVGSFFQANRHLVDRLYADVGDLARAVPPGRGLDAFGGGGLFAGALLDAGHDVTTVEGSRSAVGDALRARAIWEDGSRWSVVRSDVASFLARAKQGFSVAVVDPPRGGLGREVAGLLTERVSSRIVYVSCEPATLARDLSDILARGFHVAQARLSISSEERIGSRPS